MKHSLLSKTRRRFLRNLGRNLELEGSFVELGTWRGGSAGEFISQLGDKQRQCWLFDSFEGMPAPTEHDVTHKKHASRYAYFGMPDDDANTYDICVQHLQELDYPFESIHIIKGWFEDTFPQYADAVGDIAVLHVDCDWYESVKLSLETFYDKVVSSGIVIFDDYGTWHGCKKAVDEFLTEELIVIDNTGRYLVKP